MEKLNGVVKQVISADTYVLLGAKKDGIAQERQVSLACIQCPKLFMKSQNVEKNEEPYAWEARELIRKLIIGKSVHFNIEYVYNNRTYCSVFYEDQNLSILLLQKGYANLVQNKNVKTDVYANLEEYYLQAKQKQLGIFGEGINFYTRSIVFSQNDKNENKKIYELFANKKIPCVIEHVRDGSNFRVFAEDVSMRKSQGKAVAEVGKTQSGNEKKKRSSVRRKSKEEGREDDEDGGEKYKTMYSFSVTLCGIIVDMFKKEMVNDVETVKEEPFAMETKRFVEQRLLNREVDVEIKHIDNNCNLYANIHYKLGNICTLLLKSGYAYLNDYTIKYTPNPMEYRKALDEAIKYRKKKWEHYCEKEVDFEKEYIATVIEVLYGDIIIVDYKNEERRLYLASIKCEKQNSDQRLNTLSMIAKDYLKNEIIGEKVKIVTEYVKTPQTNSAGYIPQCSDEKGRMHFVSVYKMENHRKDKSRGSDSNNISSPSKWKDKKDRKKLKRVSNGVTIPGNQKATGGSKKETKEEKNKSKEEGSNEYLLNETSTAETNEIDMNETSEWVNLNEQLVLRGLAKVMNHKQEDEKASNYFHLQELEKEAEEKKVGRFNPHIEIIKINNISGSDNSLRARSFENTLNKYNNLTAHVDYIYGATKFKLYVPSQNLMINFLLLGITVQRINVKDVNSVDSKSRIQNASMMNGTGGKAAKEKDGYKEFAIQAYRYTRKQLMQRKVQITVITCDKGGNFIGILKHNNKNFAVHLLSMGYGVLNEIGLNSTSEKASYIKAVEEAKNKKKNIWSIEKAECADGLLKGETDLSTYDNIYYCSYLDDINNVYIQLKSKQEELRLLQEDLNKASFLENAKETEVSRNSLVLAKYIDELWYRAVVLQVNKSKKKALVKYIDFGNEEEIQFNDIKKLPETYNLKNFPPFAIKSCIAGLKVPKENKLELMTYIKKLLVDKFLYVKFEKKDGNYFHVVFYDYEQFTNNKNVRSVNEDIVLNGICYLDINSDTKIFEKLKKEEDQAKKNKLLIWSYGDIDYDEVE